MFTDVQEPCRQRDPELWFSNRASHQAKAKSLCGVCPVRATCLERALEFEELSQEMLHGIHGGFTPKERAKIRRRKAA